MPLKRQYTAVIRSMEAKVEALENKLADIRSSVTAVENAVKDMPAALMAMLEKSLVRSIQVSETSVQVQKGVGVSEKSSETMREMTGVGSSSKVELPSFDGNDPAGWISRAEVYFRVHDTPPEVKVSLAQPCMDGSTTHFFNSIVDEDRSLTWEGLKDVLLERYGGNGEGDVYEQLIDLHQAISVLSNCGAMVAMADIHGGF
ncbi:unnamed protein product [Lathyrus sativus]|nr:unnamed protein product [Lathyrus sativus]